MKIGTKSVLFGAHQFLIHPLFVALAWWQLYGFPWDPRLWVAFFVHDLGYLGKPNMDGPEGESHPWLGARIMGLLFDRGTPDVSTAADCLLTEAHCRRESHTLDGEWVIEDDADRDAHDRYEEYLELSDALYALTFWQDFTFYHSRFMARQHGRAISRLCLADKLAFTLEPWWFYLPRVVATGEIAEYLADHADGKRYGDGSASTNCGLRQWHAEVVRYLRAYVAKHRDGRADTWTPAVTESEGA